MHARDAEQLARMDGTALKAYFALVAAGAAGLSSAECAAAVAYGQRQTQIALADLVEQGRATISRAGRLVRYFAVAMAWTAADNDAADTGKTAKDTRLNVMLSGTQAATLQASHSKNSEESAAKPAQIEQLAEHRHEQQTDHKKHTGAPECANAPAAKPIAEGMTPTPNTGFNRPQYTRSPVRQSPPSAQPRAPMTGDTRSPVRQSPRSAQPRAPIAKSAQPDAPIPVSPPAPPSSKTERHREQQQPTGIGRPHASRVVVVGSFAADLERPGYLPALRRAIGSRKNPMSETDFAAAVATYGLDYCEKQYALLLTSYDRPEQITGRLWLAAIRNDYVGSNAERTRRMLEIGKKLDSRTQAQQTAIRRAVQENDAANAAQAEAERDELRAMLERMTEDQLAAIVDTVGNLPHHRPRNAVADAKRRGLRSIDVLTRPTIAPYTRDVLAEKNRASSTSRGNSAA